MPKSTANPTTKESITSMPAQEIKDEMTRAIWTTFQLEGIAQSLTREKAAQDEFKGEIRQKFESINQSLNTLPDKYATKSELEEKIKPIRADVDGINSNISWVVKTVVGVVIIALLSLVVISRTSGL